MSQYTKRQRYNEGREAYELGYALDDNPYEGEGRKQWFYGYLDARTADRLREVFQRRGINWPTHA